jgi:predicted SAM-dependent methyltransferase
MKINLGAGDQYADGWHNVDHGSPHRKDEDVDLTGPLPWAENSIDCIYAGHVLEHLTQEECVALLERLHPLMKPGGELMVVGPDVRIAEQMAQQGTLDVTLDSLKYGAGRWSGDVHRWECTSRGLQDLLETAGWQEVTELSINDVPAMWPVAYRGPQWQCAVHAKR